MKKNIYFAMAIVATALFAACSSEDDAVTRVEEPQGITIIANLPQDGITRVAYEETTSGSNYGVKETWETGDKLRCTYWQSGEGTQRSENNDVNYETGAVKIQKNPADNAYVYLSYPIGLSTPTVADAAGTTATWSSLDQSNYVYADINALKTGGKNLLVGSFQYTGSTTQTVTLQNVYALLKFSVKVPTTAASIKNIKIGKLNGDQNKRATITNKATDIVMTGTTISYSGTANGAIDSPSSATYTLTGDGTYKEATFYALVIPQKFDKGLYLELKDANNVTYTYMKPTGKSGQAADQTLEAGKMYGIKAVLTAPSE